MGLTRKPYVTNCLSLLLCVPGLVSSDVALNDDSFLFEEPEIPPAEETPDVPLDGDSRPGLSAAPFLL